MSNDDGMEFLRRQGFLEESENPQTPTSSGSGSQNSPSPKAKKEKGSRDELTKAFEVLRTILAHFSPEYPTNRVRTIMLAVECLTAVQQLLQQLEPTQYSSPDMANTTGMCYPVLHNYGYDGSFSEEYPQLQPFFD